MQRAAVLENAADGRVILDRDVANSRYWDQISDLIQAIPRGSRHQAFRDFFADFVHATDVADFVYWLSLANLSIPVGPAPTSAEASALCKWLLKRTGPPTCQIRKLGAPLADVEPISIMMDWSTAVAMPKIGPEFQGEMVMVSSGMSVAAFRPAAAVIELLAQSQGITPWTTHATIAGAALELLLGGIQSISYQNAIGRPPQAALLAQIVSRGFLLVGQNSHEELVFTSAG